MKRFIINLVTTLIIVACTAIACVGSYNAHGRSTEIIVHPPEVVIEIDHQPEYIEIAPEYVHKKTGQIDIPITSGPLVLTYEEQCLLLDIAMAEAEGEDTIGKALVMITVLNRVNEYDSSIGEIIYAPHQFATYRMGIQPSDDCYEALEMVINGWNEYQIPGDWDHSKKIRWFCADGYSIYGEPMFRYGGHSFSGK